MLDIPDHDTSAPFPRDGQATSEEQPAGDFITNAVSAADLAPAGHTAALELWAAARADAPDEAGACRALLAGLRSRKLHAAADVIARAAAAHFPDAAWPLIDLAAARARMGNHQAALALGREIMAAFPEEGEGPHFVLTALKGLGRKQETQELFAAVSLDPALHGLHREEWFLELGIKLGLARSDHALVALYAAALREVMPENVSGYVGGSMALRKLGRAEEAQAIARRGTEIHPTSMFLWKELAASTRTLNQGEEAYAIYEEIIRRFPDVPAGHIGALNLSVTLVQPAVTRTLLARALEAFPKDKQIVAMAARMALKSNQENEASKHWRTLIKEAPDNPHLRLTAAMSLMKQKKGRRKRVPSVLAKLDKLHESFPGFIPAYTAHLSVLREAAQIGTAARLATEWGKRFPGDQDLAIIRAELEQERERFGHAIEVLKSVRRQSTPSPGCEAAYIRALSLHGRMKKAEATCQAALDSFGDDPEILTEYVRLATRRGDWAEAARRASYAQQRRPRDGSMVKLALSIRTQLVGDEALLATLGAEPVVGSLAAVDVAPEETAVLLSCESLGATSAGCEFGLVQRRFGAEPFGMFRWALIGIDKLTKALLNQFEDVGSEATTELAIRRESATHQEYYVVDKKVGYLTHTFVKAEDSPEDRMLKQSVRRMRFLRGKLIEDLHAAEKVFIYKFAMKFDEDALRRMFAAVRTYGPCTLLCVTFADQNHPNGELQMLEPGLFVGRTGMFMDAVVPDEQGVDTQTWFAHCRDVVAWHKAQREASVAAAA
jgi:predicted Zn-dependent protease